jgi:hypothetical protein
MSADFVVPRAHKGKKDASNLVTACRPCNLVKARRQFNSIEAAKAMCFSGGLNSAKSGREQRPACVRLRNRYSPETKGLACCKCLVQNGEHEIRLCQRLKPTTRIPRCSSRG